MLRPRLIERLNEGLHHKLTLISAPAGFGKTTLVSAWLVDHPQSAAWLSLDAGENDLARFLTYVVAALQMLEPTLGARVSGLLQSPQPPSIEAMMTTLLNDVATLADDFILVLDDYHTIEAHAIDQTLTFLLQRAPPHMHLVIITREDPHLPLAGFRARGDLTELRAADLRFTSSEAAEFLNQVMGLTLSAEDIAALERRTEGWIAGLQLAALSLQGHHDAATFIASFTGSHHFVLDYLTEEVLQQLPQRIQTFLLRTSILDRLCGPLCDAVVRDPTAGGQPTLEYLQHANLFVIPLDDERRWYRYHHLFADLLRQRLRQTATSPGEEGKEDVAELHRRASAWYEKHGLEVEAFNHAAAADDVERAARLIEGKGMPLHFRGAVAPVLNWLTTLPTETLDAWPELRTAFASVLLVTGHVAAAEEKLQAAENTLERAALDDKARDLVGRIAAIRATAAVTQNRIDTVISQSRRALEYLRPDNLAFRTSTAWKLGFAYQLQGDRAAAHRAYTDVMSIGQASGNTIFTVMATIGLGILQEGANRLHEAAETYQRALQALGEHPLPFACEAYLGLARICYEWNDLDTALQHGRQSLELARQIDHTDRFIACEVLLARLKLAQGDASGAAALLAQAAQSARQQNFVHHLSEVGAARVLALLRQGDVVAAAQLAETHNLPITQARVRLAQGDPSAALAAVVSWRRQVEAKGWDDERLRALTLQAVVVQALGKHEQAARHLVEALALAEPGGYIRLFIDEGYQMARLLSRAATLGGPPGYIEKLLTEFDGEVQKDEMSSRPLSAAPDRPPIEPLSPREIEVLHLIAYGYSNFEISERLVLALSTVKGHNRSIFGKLQVRRRTEAVARARELGLL